jgi:regulator of ribonuclease activity A
MATTRSILTGLRIRPFVSPQITSCGAHSVVNSIRPLAVASLGKSKRYYTPSVRLQSMPSSQEPGLSPATADLCDKYVTSPSRLIVAQPGYFKDYGGIKSFSGRVETVKCFESNPMVRSTLGDPGEGRVLVVDGGGSQRVAICGDMLAQMGCDNGWSGIIVNGCIRDSAVIAKIPIGVKAINTHPLKSAKTHQGERGCTVAFAGVEFVPGMYVYADEDGVIVSENALNLD